MFHETSTTDQKYSFEKTKLNVYAVSLLDEIMSDKTCNMNKILKVAKYAVHMSSKTVYSLQVYILEPSKIYIIILGKVSSWRRNPNL